MSDVRCRACGAAVPAAAEWCSLCFADLRQPAPVREPVSVPASVPGAPPAVAEAAALASPTAAVASAAVSLPSPRSTVATPVGDKARWPCPRCSELVALSLDACETCGAGFLAGATTAALARLPVIGDVGQLTSSQRLLFAGAVAFAVTVVLLLLATLGAKLF